MALRGSENGKPQSTRRMSRTVPSDPRETDITDFFKQEQKPLDRRGPADRVDVDIDTLPNLEPYRREVVAQQSITFGHRPSSASRMFNPCTMATSCGIPSGGDSSTSGNGGRKGRASSTRGGASRTQRQPHLKKGRGRKPRRTTGLSAPMLKALLRGDNPTAADSGGEKAAVATVHGSDIHKVDFDLTISNNDQNSPTTSKYLVVNRRDDFSDSVNCDRLNESMWRPVDPAGGEARGELKAPWLTNSGLGGESCEQRGLGDSVEELELRRIFSSEVGAASATSKRQLLYCFRGNFPPELVLTLGVSRFYGSFRGAAVCTCVYNLRAVNFSATVFKYNR